jgi:outer membrane protein assembly factor BamE (lipoprotein component of BamABCDE complex)
VRRRRRSNLAAAVLALLVCAGCTVVRVTVGSPLRDDAAQRLVANETTKAQVLASFGPPDVIVRQLDGDVFIYRYVRRNTSTFTLEEPVITNFTFFTYTRSNERDDRLSILFDERGVVRSFGLRRGTEELGRF